MTPNLFDVIRMPASIADLPVPEHPYYALSTDGLYVHKTGPLGRALIPLGQLNELPESAFLPVDKNIKEGGFWYHAPKLPAWLIAQVFDFFVKVYDKHSTEAEVLLTYHAKTQTFRPFVPNQRANGGGVRSIHDAANIQRGWQLIGSIHSHCDFSAFHSGTDTADASEFPGLHITIGDIKKDNPSFDAMIMINGKKFDYQISQVADLSNLRNVPSPEWWMRYVLTGNTPIKRTGTLTEAAVIAFNTQGPIWAKNNPQTGRTVVHTPHTHSPTTSNSQLWDRDAWGDDFDEYGIADYYRIQRNITPVPTNVPRPPVWTPEKSYCSQLGGHVAKELLDSKKDIIPSLAPEAFYERLTILTNLAAEFGITLWFTLLDPDGDEYIIADDYSVPIEASNVGRWTVEPSDFPEARHASEPTPDTNQIPLPTDTGDDFADSTLLPN